MEVSVLVCLIRYLSRNKRLFFRNLITMPTLYSRSCLSSTPKLALPVIQVAPIAKKNYSLWGYFPGERLVSG
ncbi:MAG: hypothetical protein STSR0007_07180 [Thermovirga sp.]